MGVIRPPSSEHETAPPDRRLKLSQGEYQKRKFLLFWNVMIAVAAVFAIVIMSPQMRFKILIASLIVLLLFAALWKLIAWAVERAEKEQRNDSRSHRIE